MATIIHPVLLAPWDTVQSLGNSGASKTIDWSAGGVVTMTLDNAPCVLSWGVGAAAPVAGQTLTFFLTQDAGGSKTVMWPSPAIKWANGAAPTLTTTAAKTDIIAVFYDGASYWGLVGGQNY